MVVFTMSANSQTSENDLALGAVSWLREHLPSTWEVGPTSRAEFQRDERRFDAAIDLRGPNGVFTTMIVEAKRTVGPRDVERLLTGVGRSLRTLAGNIPILVVAPWLSVRTQEMLTAESLNYLDFTGNALIRLDNPTVYIETRGASKDPHPQTRNKARVQGPKAGRLVRWLIDVRPPYGVRDLAASADLAISYVSRLLETLESEALVDRSQRGRVESVDIPRLLRRWTETYDVFRSNKTLRYLAPGGANQALARLASTPAQIAVTGSFAASRIAPVAAPTLLSVYTDAPETVAETLGLIAADQGANVALLVPFDSVVWDRNTNEDGLTFVAPSQAAIDCLTGNGRMPAEGDALLNWMMQNDGRWRLRDLPMGTT